MSPRRLYDPYRAVIRQFNRRGVRYVVVGMAGRDRLVRLGGLALFWVTIFKVFLVDSFELTQGYRVASFFILGALLLATGYLLQRYRQRIREFLLE